MVSWFYGSSDYEDVVQQAGAEGLLQEVQKPRRYEVACVLEKCTLMKFLPGTTYVVSQ